METKWTTCTVGDVASPVRNALVGGPFGSNLVSADYMESGVPVIRGQNMGLGRWVDGDFVYVTEEKANSLSANLARPGDIIFTQRGTLGQVAIVPEGQFDIYLISQSQMKITVDDNKADGLFLYYVFSSQEQQDYIKRNAIQTGVPHSNLGILKNTPLTLPSLPEQRTIARILGSLDDKIELNRKMNTVLEETALSIFKAWFVEFEPVRAKARGRTPESADAESAALFPNSFESVEGREVPQGWKIGPIDHFAQIVGGSTPSTKEPTFWDGGTIHWATPKDLSTLTSSILLEPERRITELGLEQISSGLLPKGTVLLSSRAPIGYIAIADIPVAINQGFIAIVCNGALPNYYILHWLQENLEQIKARANGTTFLEISKANFRPMQVLVPSAPVLEAFTDVVEPLYNQVKNNLRQSCTLATIRDSLLPKLLSGEIRVQDIEIFVEEQG